MHVFNIIILFVVYLTLLFYLWNVTVILDIADAPIETCEFGIQASVATREFGVQAEPEVQWEGATDIDGTDNNCIMKISKLEF